MGRWGTFVVGLVAGAAVAGSVTYLMVGDIDDRPAAPRVPRPSVAASPTPSATEASDPSPLPSGSPGADGRVAGLDESDPLRLDGIGGIVVGMTVAEAEAAIGHEIRVSDDFSRHCRYATVVGGPRDLALMLSLGRIVRVDVFHRSKIQTVSGVAIGDPAEEVFRTYGDRIQEQPHPYLGRRGSYLVYHPEDDTELLLIFETDRETVTSFRSGYDEQVRYIEGCA